MTHCARLLEVLRDGRPHDHLSLYRLGMIVHSRVADLRKQGHRIVCWRDGDLSMYQLVGSLTEGVSVANPGVATDPAGINPQAPSVSESLPEAAEQRAEPPPPTLSDGAPLSTQQAGSTEAVPSAASVSDQLTLDEVAA